eukprot:7812211-Pyramimonas_sp.AAC.1
MDWSAPAPAPPATSGPARPQSCGLDEGLPVSTVNANCWGTLKKTTLRAVYRISLSRRSIAYE